MKQEKSKLLTIKKDKLLLKGRRRRTKLTSKLTTSPCVIIEILKRNKRILVTVVKNKYNAILEP